MNELLTEQISHDDLKTYLKAFYKYAKKALNIERDPRIFFRRDQENADNFIGKTGYYDPEKEEIHLFITDRHAKDVVRSFAHELIHHLQKLTGVTDNIDMSITGEDAAYSLHDDLLRAMEAHAFKDGNLTFRDWTDKMKIGLITVISERKLKPSEKKKLIGLEKDVPEAPFTKKYGKKKGKQIYYATLTKQAKKKKKSKTMKEEKTMKLKVKRMEEEGKMEEALPSKMEPPKKMSKVDRIMRDLEGEREELQSAPGAGDIGGGSSVSSRSYKEPKMTQAEKDAEREARLYNQYGATKPVDKDRQAKEAEIKARLARMSDEEFDKYANDMIAMINSMPDDEEPMLEQPVMQESKKNPYPVLFEQRERLLKEVYQTREERVYQELVRRFIKK